MRIVFGLILFFLLVISITSESFSEREVNLEKSDPKSPISAKIPVIIQQWQSSLNPASFAQDNGLKYLDGKITVYIYLDSAESISQLSQTIEITSSADNIVVAFLGSRQITQVSQLDFVQRIDLPILAETPPIPIVNDETVNDETVNDETVNDETVNDEEKQQSYDLYYAVIPAIVAIIIIAYVLKKR